LRPAADAPASVWLWWVLAGGTDDEMRARLAEVPEAIREKVRKDGRRVIRESNKARRK